jgi:hypothetical protein
VTVIADDWLSAGNRNLSTLDNGFETALPKKWIWRKASSGEWVFHFAFAKQEA